MPSVVYPAATREIGERRRALAPAIHEAFDAFGQQVLPRAALGVLPRSAPIGRRRPPGVMPPR